MSIADAFPVSLPSSCERKKSQERGFEFFTRINRSQNFLDATVNQCANEILLSICSPAFFDSRLISLIQSVREKGQKVK